MASSFTLIDPLGDAVPRRVDLGADGPLDLDAHHLPDILSCTLGAWQPTSPAADLYTGTWTGSGGFFRLDLVFAGLVNPPGMLGDTFDPFMYGPHPVFGYVEMDMDAEVETGGELSEPDLRYLGNAARFGGLPDKNRYEERAAVDASAFDGDPRTEPLVDRSGEEFHIAFHGWQIEQVQRSDDSDSVFGPGETWVLTGPLFHRAHGYERFSYACCQGLPGSYQPTVQLRFQHSLGLDQTTVSLVYPLNNHASAAMQASAVVEPLDLDASNQNSVLEALNELRFSAKNATSSWRNDPAFGIIGEWAEEAPTEFLDPSKWKVNILVGGSYSEPQPDALFVWSDLAPDVLFGDFDGDGAVQNKDLRLFRDFLSDRDGDEDWDLDGAEDGAVHLVDFGPNFSIFDLNDDGVVDQQDRELIPRIQVDADFDHDGDVDQADFGYLQSCLRTQLPLPPACLAADLDQDGRVNQDDLEGFLGCVSGAAILADPACRN